MLRIDDYPFAFGLPATVPINKSLHLSFHVPCRHVHVEPFGADAARCAREPAGGLGGWEDWEDWEHWEDWEDWETL